MTTAHAQEDAALLLAAGLRPWETALLTTAEATALADLIEHTRTTQA